MILSSNVSSEKIFLFFSRLGKSIPNLVRLSGRRRTSAHENVSSLPLFSGESPLSVEDVAKPEVAQDQVIVKIETSGLRHTDIHAAHGDWPVKPNLPFIPGHEGVGIVEQVGPGVITVKEGDRVAIPWLGYACGTCEYCVSGWETLCEQQLNSGTLVFVALPADNYMQLPIFETVLNGIKIVGSIVGTRLDLAEVFELHADGKTQVIYEKRHLEDVNHAFEEIEKARVPARLVFDMM